MFYLSFICFSKIMVNFKKFYNAFAVCFDIYFYPPKTEDSVSSTKDMIDFRRKLLLFDCPLIDLSFLIVLKRKWSL